MESMHQCEKCGGWVKSISRSTCTCPKIVATSGHENFLTDGDRRVLVVDDSTVLTSEQIKELVAPYHESAITPPTPEQQAKLNEELEALEKQARLREIQRDFGPGAVQVAPYKPNRKQRRAQEAVKRKVAKNYPLRRKEYKRDE